MRRSKGWSMRHVGSLFFALAVLTTIACAHQAPEPSDDAVARVGAVQIHRSQFQALVDQNLARYTSQGKSLPPGITSRIEESVMRRLIDDTIVEQEAIKRGIRVTDEQLDTSFKEHKQRFRTEQAFADYLQRSNNTEVVLREDLRKSMLRDAVVDKLSGPVAIGDADVETYYHENLKHYVEPEQMRARRILFTIASQADAGHKRAAQKEAKKVHDLLLRPKADFAALAREFGKGPEASRDGDLSIVTPGHMPELDKAVAAGLRPGQTTDVLTCEQGLAIFRLDEHTLARQHPVDEVRDMIRTQLFMRETNERRQAILRQLKGDANIEIFIKFEAQPLPVQAAPTGKDSKPPVSGAAKAH